MKKLIASLLAAAISFLIIGGAFLIMKEIIEGNFKFLMSLFSSIAVVIGLFCSIDTLTKKS